MDTNLVYQLLARSQDSSQWVEVVKLLLIALSPVLATVAAYFASKAAALSKEIKVDVNSEKSKLLSKLDALTAEVLRISEKNKTMEERERGRDIAAALKDQQPKQ